MTKEQLQSILEAAGKRFEKTNAEPGPKYDGSSLEELKKAQKSGFPIEVL